MGKIGETTNCPKCDEPDFALGIERGPDPGQVKAGVKNPDTVPLRKRGNAIRADMNLKRAFRETQTSSEEKSSQTRRRRSSRLVARRTLPRVTTSAPQVCPDSVLHSGRILGGRHLRCCNG